LFLLCILLGQPVFYFILYFYTSYTLLDPQTSHLSSSSGMCWSPRLSRSHYCQQLTLSVCPDDPMSVRLSRSFKLILLFCFSMELSYFLAVISPCGTLQNVVLFRPPNAQNLLPKICTKSPISRLVWQIDRRCLGLPGGFRGLPIQWNCAKCCGTDHCCHGNKIWARRGDPVAYRLVVIHLSWHYLCFACLDHYKLQVLFLHVTWFPVSTSTRRHCDCCMFVYAFDNVSWSRISKSAGDRDSVPKEHL